MKKKYYLVIGILILLIIGGYFSTQRKSNLITQSEDIKNSINTYENKELGFKFNLPENWVESNSKDIFDTGDTKLLFFKNNKTGNRLTISYHKPPKGKSHFSDLKEEFSKNKWIYSEGKKELIVSNRKAIQGTQVNSVNSKGIPLENPNYTVLISFEGIEDSSSYDIEFKYVKINELIAVKNLDLILNSFRLN